MALEKMATLMYTDLIAVMIASSKICILFFSNLIIVISRAV